MTDWLSLTTHEFASGALSFSLFNSAATKFLDKLTPLEITAAAIEDATGLRTSLRLAA